MPADLGSNQLLVRAGFTVENGVAGIDDIAKQIKKINTESSKLGESIKTIEQAFAKMGLSYSAETGKVVAATKLQTAQMTEQAKQQTAITAAESKERVARAEAESKERVARARAEQKELEEIAKQITAQAVEEEKRKTENARSQNKIREQDNKAVNDKQVSDTKSTNKMLESEQKASDAIRVAEARERARQETIAAKSSADQQKIILRDQVSSARSAYNDMVSEYKKAATKITNISKEIGAISRQNITFSGARDRGVLGYSVANAALQVTGIRTLLNEFSQISREVVDVEKNAINIQRIMHDTSSELRQQLNDAAFQTAKDTATLVTDVQDIQASWVRVNEQYQENLDLLDQITTATAKFINVGEINDAEEAVSLLNSAILQFNMFTEDGTVDIEQATETLNKWAYMADMTALGTADEFGDSISRFGGILRSIGGDMDDAIVLTSILGDRLAKTGDEAGNSLKTLMSYLTRDKTINLFNKLSLDADGLTSSLMKTETQFEEFRVIMSTVSDAYNSAMERGDEVTARAIQQAIGATRQGDAAIALLKNWNEDYAKYTAMLNDGAVNGYLDEQNEALLGSLSAKWDSLKNSLIEAGTAIANSGLIDGVETLMTGVGNMADAISNANPVLLEYVTTLGEVGLALAALNKIGKITGIKDVFLTGMNFGSTANRQEAAELARQNAELERNAAEWMKASEARAMFLTGSASEAEFLMIHAQMEQINAELQTATEKYKAGEISIQQYTAAQQAANDKLKEQMVLFEQLKAKGRENLESTRDETFATEEAAEAQQVENTADVEGSAANAANAATEHADAQANRENAAAIRDVTRAQALENAADAAGATVNTTAAATERVGMFSRIGAGISSVGTAFKTMLSSPLGKVTAVIMVAVAAFKGLSSIIDKFVVTAEEAREELDNTKESIDEYNSKIDEQKERLEELEALKTNGAITEAQQSELNNIKAQNELYRAQIDILRQKEQAQTKEAGQKTYKQLMSPEYRSKDMDEYMNAADYQNYLATKIKEYKELQKELVDESGNITDPSRYESYEEKIQGLIADQTNFTKQIIDLLPYLDLTDAKQKELFDSLKRGANEAMAAIQGISTADYMFNSLMNDSSFSDKKDSLVAKANEGTLTADDIANCAELNNIMVETGISADELIDKLSNIGTVAPEAADEASDGFSDFIKQLSGTIDLIEGVDSDIEKIQQNKLQASDYADLIDKYQGFSSVINASTAEQIEWLRQYKQELSSGYDLSIQEKINELTQKRADLYQKITEVQQQVADGAIETADGTEQIMATKDAISDLTDQIEKLKAYNGLNLSIKLTSELGLSNMMAEINNVVSGVEKLTDAQYKLAQGTALSKAELLELCNVYPELLQQADLFNRDTVEGQQEAINAVLGMKEEEFDALIDQKIELLKADEEAIKSQIDIENQKLGVILELKNLEAQGKNEQDVDYQNKLNDLEELEGENYYDLEKGNLETQVNALTTMSQNASSTSDNIGNSADSAQGRVIDSMKTAAEKGSQNLDKLAKGAADSFRSLNGVLSQTATSIKNALSGNYYNIGASAGAGGVIAPWSGVYSTTGPGSQMDVYYPGLSSLSSSLEKGTITLEDAQKTIEDAKVGLQKDLDRVQAELGNLTSMKGLDLGQITGSYDNSSGSSGGSGGSGSSGKDADEAAAEAAEKIADAISKYYDQYQQNVESLQDRIVNALKAKYTEMFNVRKRQLEQEQEAQQKVHNDRIKQLQDEIDKLNGNTKEDKYAKRDKLQADLDAWMADDSSLGKSKQKDLKTQLKDINKEIKIAELEEEVSKEEDELSKIENHFQELLDEDSPNYDPQLKDLSTKMTDQQLYAQANDLIRNNKIQDIIDLITEYDPDYSGIAGLMGQTAGQIIASEVKNAMANWIDLLTGAITENGGVFSKTRENEEFVKNMYKTYLGRNADLNGLQAWVEKLNSGEMTQDQVKNAFKDSDEYKKKYIASLYRDMLGREGSQKEINAQFNDLKNKGLTLTDLYNAFEASPEYRRKYITQLYKEILGRNPDKAGLEGWVNSGQSLTEIRLALLNSDEYKKRPNSGVKDDAYAQNTKIKATEKYDGETSLWGYALKYYGEGTKWTKIADANNIKSEDDLKKGQKILIPYKTGGATGEYEGEIYIHKKERVLTEAQNKAFEHLVYDFIPTISKRLLTPVDSSKQYNTDNSVNFNKELMTIHIDKVENNTPFDVQNNQDNIERMLKKSLMRSGVNIKR